MTKFLITEPYPIPKHNYYNNNFTIINKQQIKSLLKENCEYCSLIYSITGIFNYL